MAELKLPEVLPDKIEYTQKIADKMDSIFKEDAVAPFIGSMLLTDLFYLYLFNKYGMKCFDERQIESNIAIYQNKNDDDAETLQIITNYIIILSNCITNINPTKLVIIPFGFAMFDNNNELVGGHSNLLIYRPETRGLEHFEPHGSTYGGPLAKIVNAKIKKYLTMIVSGINNTIKDITKHIKLIPSYDVCPTKKFRGLQDWEGNSELELNPTIEPDGYCAAWSMFFAELCLKNPTIPTKDVYTKIMEQANSKSSTQSKLSDYFRKIIRGYTVFINNKIVKYYSHIFNEPDLNTQKIKNVVNGVDNNLKIIEKYAYIIKKLNTPLPNTGLKRYNEFKKNIAPGTSPEDKKHRQMDDTPTDVNRSFNNLNTGIRLFSASPISQQKANKRLFTSPSPISQQKINNQLFSASPISQQKINNQLFSASPTINDKHITKRKGRKTTKQSPILFNETPTINDKFITKRRKEKTSPIIDDKFITKRRKEKTTSPTINDKFITKRRKGTKMCDSSLKRCYNGCTRNKRNSLCEPTNIKT